MFDSTDWVKLMVILMVKTTCVELKRSSVRQTRCSAIAERPRCRVRYSFRQK